MAYVTRQRSDPLRNFKFQVQLVYPPLANVLADMAFTNVAGLSMNTEMVPYREGGWNTNFHKLPGQTDFGPLTLIQGIMHARPGMWELAKTMFAVQWGNGTLLDTTDFRYTTVIRVLDHPITRGPGSGVNVSPQGARLAFVLYNCWTGSVAFNDLDATGNAVLVSQMTMHHEGFDVVYGQDASRV
jgi:phage tail-like protein